jgi:hypothetical protein
MYDEDFARFECCHECGRHIPKCICYDEDEEDEQPETAPA